MDVSLFLLLKTIEIFFWLRDAEGDSLRAFDFNRNAYV